MSKIDWELIFILPNLTLREPIEFSKIAITNRQDERIQKIAQENSVAHHLIDSFIDQNSRPASPSYLIIEKDSIDEGNIGSAAVAYRNIISLCTIYYGWRHQISTDDPNVFAPLYSDYYDFYPIHGFDEKYFVISSPALRDIQHPEDFVAQRSPRLPTTNHFLFHFDKHLLNSLMKLWKRKYLNNDDDNKLKSLFRALEMAYNACKLPDNNLSTIHDYGMILGLWVSAFEILFHPGGNKSVKYQDITDLFNSHHFSSNKLNENKYSLNKHLESNIAGKLYKEIYDTRNAFYHGNRVNSEDLYPFKDNRLPPLPHLAPVLFTFGLILYLDKNFSFLDSDLSEFDEPIEKLIATLGIENSLIKFAV